MLPLREAGREMRMREEMNLLTPPHRSTNPRYRDNYQAMTWQPQHADTQVSTNHNIQLQPDIIHDNQQQNQPIVGYACNC